MPTSACVDISRYWNNRYNFTVTVDDLELKPIPHTSESRRGSRRIDDSGIVENEPCNPGSFYGDLQERGLFDEQVL